jgi:hypothetical protein
MSDEEEPDITGEDDEEDFDDEDDEEVRGSDDDDDGKVLDFLFSFVYSLDAALLFSHADIDS